jgi:hypothetical protein
MESIGIPLLIVSLFWLIVGGVLPFFAKGPNRSYDSHLILIIFPSKTNLRQTFNSSLKFQGLSE